MAEVALGNGASLIQAADGTIGSVCGLGQNLWDTPTIFATDTCSSTVSVGGFGVVCEQDTMESHPDGAICTSTPVNHSPYIQEGSSSVYVDGKRVAMVGDKFNGGTAIDHTIITGSSSVFIG